MLLIDNHYQIKKLAFKPAFFVGLKQVLIEQAAFHERPEILFRFSKVPICGDVDQIYGLLKCNEQRLLIAVFVKIKLLNQLPRKLVGDFSLAGEGIDGFAYCGDDFQAHSFFH